MTRLACIMSVGYCTRCRTTNAGTLMMLMSGIDPGTRGGTLIKDLRSLLIRDYR